MAGKRQDMRRWGAAAVLVLAGGAGSAALAAPAALPKVPYLALDDTPPKPTIAADSASLGAVGDEAPPTDDTAPDTGGGAGTSEILKASSDNMPVPRRVLIKPYAEIGQVFDVPFSGRGASSEGYALAALGADMQLNGRNTQAGASLRYEHRFGDIGSGSNPYSGNGDTISGVARGRTQLDGPRLWLDYGGMATQSYVSWSGAATDTLPGSYGNNTKLYTGYIGPAFATRTGDLTIRGDYHIGYTAEDGHTTYTQPGLTPASAGTIANFGLFDHTTAQKASLSIGNTPGQGLPVGLGVEGGFQQENISTLDQRARDYHARAQIVIPVDAHVALIGGLGFENVEVSARGALTDANGNLVLGSGGEPQTDPASPRYIAYETSGLIWDGGLTWQPSRRFSLEAHVGRRYGHLGVNGTLAWRPTGRTALNVAVYDTLGGFGSGMMSAVAAVPTSFVGVRDAVTGQLVGCVASVQGGGCLGSALGSVSALVYRDEGVIASFGTMRGHMTAGIGLGYDRHRYIGAPGTVLGALNGKLDQYYWASAYITDKLTNRAGIEGTLGVYRYQSGLNSLGDMDAIRASGLYRYDFTPRLSGSAMVAVDGISRPLVDDLWTASGALGMRYTF